MLETASKLSSEEIDRLYSTQAIGPFFHRLPMRHYGGTPLAYMACFGMKRALEKVLGADDKHPNIARPNVFARLDAHGMRSADEEE